MKRNITRVTALLTLACIFTLSSQARAEEDEFIGEIKKGDAIFNVDGNLTKTDRPGTANDYHRFSFQTGVQLFIVDRFAVGPSLSVLRSGKQFFSGNDYSEHTAGLNGSYFIPMSRESAFSLGAGLSLLGYGDDSGNDLFDGYLYSGAVKFNYFINPHVSIGPTLQVAKPNYFNSTSSTTRFQILFGLGIHL